MMLLYLRTLKFDQVRTSVLLDLYTSTDSHDGGSLVAYRKGDYKVHIVKILHRICNLKIKLWDLCVFFIEILGNFVANLCNSPGLF